MTNNKNADPGRDCDLCPRLRGFILDQRKAHPEWHNAPVDTWLPKEGRTSVRLLVAGLAPGLQGANRTGRPFTGDYAGDLLYATLGKFGLTSGSYGQSPTDGLHLKGCAITNAVRCVPPQNKPVGAEINNCRVFLEATIESFANLQTVFTLGKISHDSTIRALGERPSAFPFGHAAQYRIGELNVVSSYHCSRYNTNTGRLTPEMFEQAIGLAVAG